MASRRPSNIFHCGEAPVQLQLRQTPTSFWVMNFFMFGRVEKAEELCLGTYCDVPFNRGRDDPTKRKELTGSRIDNEDLPMSPLDLFNPLRVLLLQSDDDGLTRRNTDVTASMQDFSEMTMSSRSTNSRYEDELEWELSDDDEEGNDTDDEYEQETKADGIVAYRDLSNRSSLQRMRSEASSGYGEQQDDTRSLRPCQQQQRSPSRVSFSGQVQVVDIPHHDEYSDSLRDRLWNSTREIHKIVKRNLIEFLADGWDWRSAKEENEFAKLPTGELVHPATWLQTAPLHHDPRRRDLSATTTSSSIPKKRSTRETGRSSAFEGHNNSNSMDRPARRVERRPSS